MKSLVVSLLLVLLFQPQSKPESHLPEGLFEKQSPDTGSTRVDFRLYLSGAQPYGLMLEASYTKFKTRPDLNQISEDLLLVTPQAQATPCKPQETLRLVLDGKPQSFQFTCRNGAVDNVQLQMMEPLHFEDLLIPMATANSVEGTIGRAKFKLTARQIQKIRDFLKAKRSEFSFQSVR